MDNTIEYLNTDLDLISSGDLGPLASVLKAGGIFDLHVTRMDDGLWYARFETNETYSEPEPNIAAMLDVLEKLPEPMRASWDQCTLREFNIGYDCGDKPWAFNQGLTAELLGRMAAARATLRFTLYPDKG